MNDTLTYLVDPLFENERDDRKIAKRIHEMLDSLDIETVKKISDDLEIFGREKKTREELVHIIYKCVCNDRFSANSWINVDRNEYLKILEDLEDKVGFLCFFLDNNIHKHYFTASSMIDRLEYPMDIKFVSVLNKYTGLSKIEN